ncbi:unnamed protein product [Cylicocyclus nassatus]|uniref:7TM GPCR serpentine receptor class x (Srx) domain-containing protein n=1 Tax=Cylicocyclus nassatus TaxID=53992 RepID=A0AA36H2S7_CYLNA|nr:unnamed protein product [Cylicocyclus nassatus]
MSHLYEGSSAGNIRRIKEYRYALQFCAISIFYLCAWVMFRVFPVLIGESGVEYFIVISACVTLNASANAIVYITSNFEVQSVLSGTTISSLLHASLSHTERKSRTNPTISQKVIEHRGE